MKNKFGIKIRAVNIFATPKGNNGFSDYLETT